MPRVGLALDPEITSYTLCPSQARIPKSLFLKEDTVAEVPRKVQARGSTTLATEPGPECCPMSPQLRGPAMPQFLLPYTGRPSTNAP